MKFSSHLLLPLILIFNVSCFQKDGGGNSSHEEKKDEPALHAHDPSAQFRNLIGNAMNATLKGLEDDIIFGHIRNKIDDFFGNEDEENKHGEEISELRRDFPQVLELLFQNPIQDSAKETIYSPKPSVCDEFLDKDHPKNCREVMSHITFIISETSDEQGKIAVYFDDLLPLEIQYHEKSLDFDLHVQTLMEVIQNIAMIDGSDNQAEPLPVVSGDLHISAKEISSAQVQWQIGAPEGFNFSQQKLDGVVSIALDPAEKLAELGFINTNEKVTLELSLNPWNVSFPQDQEEGSYLLGFMGQGLSMKIELEDDMRNIRLTEVNSQGLQVTVNDQVTVDASPFEMDLYLDFHGEKLVTQFMTESDFNIAFQDGSISGHNQGLTKFEWLVGENQISWNVLSGSLWIEGLGNLAGRIDLEAGDCFTVNNNEGFPFQNCNM